METGKFSSEELVSELMSLVREEDGDISAYVSIDEENVLAQAREADALRAKGGKGRLLGVPIAVKDNLNVKGQTCSCASKILKGYVSPYDATAIANLKKEGAVMAGRTNMDEFAMGSSTENSALKITRNPRNMEYVPGGSSGGSAAAVASGMAVAALGSDTGGSIRQPSAFCGCVGLKPSYGRVSRYGLTAFASSLDQIGPITKNVADSALILNVMAGFDKMDSTSLDMSVPGYSEMLTDKLDGVRIGIPSECFSDAVDESVRENVLSATKECEKLGATLMDVNLPHMEYAVAAYYIIATAEASANLARYDGVRYGFRDGNDHDVIEMYRKTRAAGFGSEVKRRIILGTYVLSSGYYDAYYLSAQKVRTLIRSDFEKAFEKCDVLLTPTVPTCAYKIGEKINDPLQMYLGDILTVTANLAGICGISVPCGAGRDGLPVGLQVLGPSFKEENIFRVANAYEMRTTR